MGELEAIGDAVTGGVLARAVEPRAGEGDGHTNEVNCLNCGSALAGPFCHECGQHAHVHRTLSAFLHDLLHGVLHFEGKIWRTLPLLAWKPGELTRRYIDGQRASFVSPIALFLFTVFLLFAVGGIAGGFSHVNSRGVGSGLKQEIAKGNRHIADLQKQRDAAAAAGQPTNALDQQIKSAREENSLLAEMSKRGMVQGATLRVSNDLPQWLREPIQKAGSNPQLLFYKMKMGAYKFSWALIPLSVPFLWLLFPFSRRFRLYDHIVFVTYSLSFMTLLAIAGLLIGFAGLPQVAGFLFLLPPIHMYRQLKVAYGLSTAGALVRTLLLIAFATIALGLFALLLVGLGLFD
jgi:uncharacterized membrane protein